MSSVSGYVITILISICLYSMEIIQAVVSGNECTRGALRKHSASRSRHPLLHFNGVTISPLRSPTNQSRQELRGSRGVKKAVGIVFLDILSSKRQRKPYSINSAHPQTSNPLVQNVVFSLKNEALPLSLLHRCREPSGISPPSSDCRDLPPWKTNLPPVRENRRQLGTRIIIPFLHQHVYPEGGVVEAKRARRRERRAFLEAVNVENPSFSTISGVPVGRGQRLPQKERHQQWRRSSAGDDVEEGDETDGHKNGKRIEDGMNVDDVCGITPTLGVAHMWRGKVGPFESLCQESDPPTRACSTVRAALCSSGAGGGILIKKETPPSGHTIGHHGRVGVPNERISPIGTTSPAAARVNTEITTRFESTSSPESTVVAALGRPLFLEDVDALNTVGQEHQVSSRGGPDIEGAANSSKVDGRRDVAAADAVAHGG